MYYRLLTTRFEMFPSQNPVARKADFHIHAISLVGVLIATAIMLSNLASGGNGPVFAATLIYALAVLFSIGISFAYHLWPRHEARATLRRWDHAAIYVVIAGTFSPLLVKAGTSSGYAILVAIWLFAMMGVWFKMVATTIDGRWSLISYLGLGWFAVFALPSFWAELPRSTTLAIAAGGMFYTVGTLFYRKKDLNFRYPIWHGFGTLGGTCFLIAIWQAVMA